MDVVITYVNGLDPQWQASYAKFAGQPALAKRFRDWGTLPYLLRGIQTCLPFVHNVYLVVASDSQVPSWVDRSQLKIVLHSDIIPSSLLPVFNSCSIEMFLHRIAGLDEEFIYLNDDMFPVLPSSAEDFFRSGKAAVHMARQYFLLGNGYRYQTKRSSDMARNMAGLPTSPFYVRPQHTFAPMLRSVSEELYSKAETSILGNVTPLRTRDNFNQYLYVDYAWFTGRCFDSKISNKHMSLGASTIDSVEKFLSAPTRNIVCINDVQMSEERYEAIRPRLLAAFQKRFPAKSRFEL